mmetsp:Transcript_2185/g.4677  ORF Transcript_2185/g.4677 Transcript_2185/m.4677 type:complete len:1037 (+) Transcript_2185:772-3882(+)
MGRLQEIMKCEQDKKVLFQLHRVEKTFVEHLQLLQKFGRYPGQNKALGRNSTQAELEYLEGLRNHNHQDTKNVLHKNISKPLRILVLHGNRANLRKFKAKVYEKMKEIGSDEVPVTLDFIKSPIIYRGDDMTESEARERDNRCWWTVKNEGDSIIYEGLEQGIDALENWFQQNGAYNGVMGFSQGATMASILAAKMYSGQLQHVRFQFLVCISGFNVRDTECSKMFSGDKICVPSFHTWGKVDKEINASRSMQLANNFHEPCTVPHQGEHLVRGVEFWPTDAMNTWVQALNLLALPMPDDTSQLNSFVEKFQAVKRNYGLLSLKGRIFCPVGLHHQEDIMSDPFWEDTSMIGNVNDIPFDTTKAFVSRLLLIPPKDVGTGKENLTDDLMTVLWCLYPFGFTRKKQNERQREAQPFYLMFRLIFDGITYSRGRERMLNYHLPFISKHANTWDALNRIDLMFHTGSSLYDSSSLKLADGPSPYAVKIHKVIARIFAEQLAIDFTTVQEAMTPYGDSHYERVLQMQLSLPSKCAENVPRVHGFLHKTTQLDLSIASEFSNISKEAVDAFPGSTRNRYRSATRRIRTFLADYKSSIGDLQNVKERGLQDYFNFSIQAWWSLHQNPISHAILYPKPEPVEVATPEQMQPLHEFLNKSPMALLEPEVTFDRGTLLNDGRLDLCKQVIGPAGIDPLFSSLKYDGHGLVKHILLGNNIAGNGLGRAVGDFICSGESKLTTWYVAGNRMNADGIAPIAAALEQDQKVLQLWLKRNPILPLGTRPIASMLRVNTTLQVLDLTNTGILDDGCETVMQGLLGNKKSALQYLYLDTNGITAKGVSAIVEYLTNTMNRSLVGLSLGCNRLGDDGLAILIKGLRRYKSLKRLTLSSCGISAAGAQMLADYLKEPGCELSFLDLSCMKSTWAVGEIPNRIESKGSVALADAIRVNTCLEGLNLGNNFIREDGIAAIEEALSQNQASVLRSLSIYQPGLASNKTTLDKINLWAERNISTWERSKASGAQDDYVFPKHLDEIQSVYRVGNSYSK